MARAASVSPGRQAPSQTPYDRDVFSWSVEQASLLREGRFHELDVANVAEEIESGGRSERSALTSCLARVMRHMLRWDRQPETRRPSRATSIRVHRSRHSGRSVTIPA